MGLLVTELVGERARDRHQLSTLLSPVPFSAFPYFLERLEGVLQMQ